MEHRFRDDRDLGQEKDNLMVNELRNYHVGKLLNHLGGKDVPPYLQKAIKRAFSEYAEDVIKSQDNGADNDTKHNEKH